MKCRLCGRGITYRLVERDATIIRLRGAAQEIYCGKCFEGVDVDPLIPTFILLGDGPSNERVCQVVFA